MADSFFNTYGLDIEIDITRGSIDPAVAPIRRVALSTERGDELFEGDERTILLALDHHLESLPSGLIATWNGSMLDLPFISERARRLGVRIDLHLEADPDGALGRQALPGRGGAHRACWGSHRHLDTFRLYGDGAPAGTWATILGLARRRGTIARTGNLLNEALHANASSDARLARVLAERRGQAALRMADRIEVESAPAPEETVDLRVVRAPQDMRPAVAGL